MGQTVKVLRKKITINYHQCPNYSTFWEKSTRSTNLPAHQPLVKFMQIAPEEIPKLLFLFEEQ